MSAIPLVACEDGRYVPNEQAMAWLESIGAPMGVVACAGKYRTGKSTLLNRGILELPPGTPGFGVEGTTQACTKGLWVYTKTIQMERCRAIVIDTEGFGAVRVDQTHDTRIFALALLLSSMFVYNTVGAIDEQSIETLRVVCNISNHIRTGAQTKTSGGGKRAREEDDDGEEEGEGGGRGGDEAALADVMPAFLFLLRDFSLGIPNGATPDAYLETVLADGGGGGTADRIRTTLRRIFPRRGCSTLPGPHVDEKVVRALDRAPLDMLNPKFVGGMKAFRARLGAETDPKLILGKPINGELLASYIRALTNALNAGSAPVIYDQWTALAALQRQKLKESALRFHERSLESFDIAMPRADLVRALKDVEDRAVDRIRRNIMTDGVDADETIRECRAACSERARAVLDRRDAAVAVEVGRSIEALAARVEAAAAVRDPDACARIVDEAWDDVSTRTGACEDGWIRGIMPLLWRWWRASVEGADEMRRDQQRHAEEVDAMQTKVAETEEALRAQTDAHAELERHMAEAVMRADALTSELRRAEETAASQATHATALQAELDAFGPLHVRLEVAERTLAEEVVAKERAVDAENSAREEASKQIAEIEAAAHATVTDAREALAMQTQRADRAERDASVARDDAEARLASQAHELSNAVAETHRLSASLDEAVARADEGRAAARREAERATAKADETRKAHLAEVEGLREEVARRTEACAAEHKERLHAHLEHTQRIKDLEIQVECGKGTIADLRRRVSEEEERGKADRVRAEDANSELTKNASELQYLRDDRRSLEERLRDATTRLEALEREHRDVMSRHTTELARVRMGYEREQAVLHQRLARARDV